MKVSANVNTCVGAGQCVLAAPNVFGQDPKTGLVEVLKADIGEEDREGAEQARLACPVRAVRLAI